MNADYWPPGSRVKINEYGLRWWHRGVWGVKREIVKISLP